MGYFKIELSNNVHGEVRWGSVRKKEIFLNLFRKHKHHSENKTGYVVTLQPDADTGDYRLFRSQNGQWSHDPDGLIPVHDKTSLDIQQAIEAHEKLHLSN